MRGLALAVRLRLYRPQPGRRVAIPKPGGGQRVLTIRGILDRVVSRALAEALTPLWERVFLPQSMGFRPHRGVWDMLAAVERIILEQDRNVLAVDDVRKAFDYVDIDGLMDDHRRHLTDPSLLSLIERVLRGGDEDRKVGIDQGSPYSPSALNLRLHHVHDLGMGQGQNPPWFRYADNLVYLCQDVSAGQQALDQARNLLKQGGHTLKGEDGDPIDLREGEVQLLGFLLRRVGDQVVYAPGPKAYDGLRKNLLQAHETDNPPLTAHQAVCGWLTSLGPACESCTESMVVNRVLQIAREYGYREVGPYARLREVWRHARVCWNALRKRACPDQACASPSV
jgi:hypothetical protein